MVAFQVTLPFLGHLGRRDPQRTWCHWAFLLGQITRPAPDPAPEGCSCYQKVWVELGPVQPLKDPLNIFLNSHWSGLESWHILGPSDCASWLSLGSRISPQLEMPSSLALAFTWSSICVLKHWKHNYSLPSLALLVLMGSHLHKHPNGNCHSVLKTKTQTTVRTRAPENTHNTKPIVLFHKKGSVWLHPLS